MLDDPSENARRSNMAARRRGKAASGICKLTLTSGPFVRSHLIPDALTKAAIKGAPLMQFAAGKRPSRRWTSWHDEQLVTRAGEDILSALDTWAIRVLRRHSLIWSSWGEATPLPPHHPVARQSDISMRLLRDVDFARLRLFLLSLLWRAAATSRYEFAEVTLPDEHLEILRTALISGALPIEGFYPATLTQVSTVGPRQNLAPLSQVMPVPNLPGLGSHQQPIFRFYFDGLVVHFHRSAARAMDGIRPLAVGASDSLVVCLVPYERSFQLMNLKEFLRENSQLGEWLRPPLLLPD